LDLDVPDHLVHLDMFSAVVPLGCWEEEEYGVNNDFDENKDMYLFEK
jgi:hypothetical protein